MVVVCETCHTNIGANQKRIKCINCTNMFHSDCVNFTNESSTARAAWKCSPCLSVSKKGKNNTNLSTNRGVTDTDTNEIVLSEIRAFRAEVNIRLNEQDEALKMLQSSFTSMRNELNELQMKVKYLENKSECSSSMESKITRLAERNEALENQINLKEQRDRFNNIEIYGIPQLPKENVYNIIIELANLLKINLQKNDIDHAYRTRVWNSGKESTSPPQEEVQSDEVSFANVVSTQKGSRESRIVVRLNSRELKIKLLRADKTWRNDRTGGSLTTSDAGFSGEKHRIFFNDHLTPMNKHILRAAKQKAREKNYAYVWVKECKIFVRKTEKSRAIQISKINDINTVII
ncbi:uncharacterized protein LOC124541568 [Vanessa cardui]|uniref:uncharacterized protein LOC124541568 n=1 Tax=Vanessa cardui TaxID=171605 RepID=UPI001F13057A|nr:uncharacterized protein LOC124541568 [Vanessa cardui]